MAAYRAVTRLPGCKSVFRRIGHGNCLPTVSGCRLRRSGFTTTAFPEFENLRSIQTHEDLYRFSLKEPSIFWGKIARNRLSWAKDFDVVMDCNLGNGKIGWFLKGRINVSENCVDRHAQITPNRVALIWEKDEPGQQEYITYRDLRDMVNQMGNMLQQHHIGKGDRVMIYLPQSPTAVVAMLACARIGAIHSVVFAGFSADALAGRIQAAQASIIITADQGIRGGKIIELKKITDAAVAKCSSVEKVFVYKRTGGDVPMGKLDIYLEEALKSHSKSLCKPTAMDSEDLLFTLYTSGSTGEPKGIAHSQAGYLLYTSVTHKHVFDYQEGEVFGCVADIGWITGHSYVVYGPLCNGATTLLFESTPLYPNPGRYWEMVERLKLNHMYLAPTSLRLLLKSGDSWVKKYDRSSLRKLGCVGEPLNHEAWEWYFHCIGEERCDVIDTWWQTETGGILIAPRPSAPNAKIEPAMPMRPFFGIDPCLVDEKGTLLTDKDAYGALCIRKPWPGMARTIYGDHDRFIHTYFKPYAGLYYTGDGAHRHLNKYYQITGRLDDVINVSGHRLGTAEIEDAMDDHPAISETAVVGFPHSIKGEGVYAYVVLKDDVKEAEDEISEELRKLVRAKIAGYAQPDFIQFTHGLPRTRSGKIMRRILKKVASDKSEDLGDISTLADPSVVDIIVKDHKKMVGK